MTLDELLSLASQRVIDSQSASDQDLARGIIDLLGEAQPCGWEQPDVNRMVAIPHSWATLVEPAEARQLAVMLLRAADSAERPR